MTNHGTSQTETNPHSRSLNRAKVVMYAKQLYTAEHNIVNCEVILTLRITMFLPVLTSSNNMTNKYKQYLNSKEWLDIRLDIITTRKKCERCGSTNRLQVHHKTYKNIFNEEPEDLELLCGGCHKKEHDLIDKEKHHKETRKRKKKVNKRQSRIRKEMEKSRKQNEYNSRY